MAGQGGQQRFFTLVYGLGASLIIIGVLFKMLHWKFGPLSGNTLLTVGLISEAVIFAISAFEPLSKSYDWELVYPQFKKGGPPILPDEHGNERFNDLVQGAQINPTVVQSLADGIRRFEEINRMVAPSADVVVGADRYMKELSKAVDSIKSLNGFYASQVESMRHYEQVTSAMKEHELQMGYQMEVFNKNLNELNRVYQGMLGAMGAHQKG